MCNAGPRTRTTPNGVMGCPKRKRPLRLYAGADALAVDLSALCQMGLSDVRQSPMLRTACHWFGDPSPRTTVVGADRPKWRGPLHNEVSAFLSLLARPVYEFGSWRGSLFVPEMDEDAFPSRKGRNSAMRLGRWAVRSLLQVRLRD